MNKKQWFASTHPPEMLLHLRDRAGDRKLRLFAVACCRRFWPIIERDAVGRMAVEVAERFADGRATVTACHLARASVVSNWGSGTDPVLCKARELARATAKSKAAGAAIDAGREATSLASRTAELAGVTCSAITAAKLAATRAECECQVRSLRCIFGNPFKPVAVESSWLTSDVLALAHGAYEERAFDRLPILADALQDAGCNNEDVLTHLRHGTEHARGCWALDLILGKS
jgi:hypothetical protein